MDDEFVGKIIGGLFCIALGIVAFVFALGLIYFVLQIAWISLPAWGVATAMMFGVLYLLTAQRFRPMNPQGTFVKMLPIRFDSRKMDWYLQETAGESYGKAVLVMAVAIILAILPLWLILSARYRSGAFQEVIWWLWFLNRPARISGNISVVCGCILSAIPVIAVAALRFKSVQNSISTRGHYVVKHMNRQLERTEELQCLVTSIGCVADQLEIPFPMIYQQKVAKFANAHKTELLADTTNRLNKVIVHTIEETREDLQELKKAQEAYDTATSLYAEAAHEVSKAGSIPLIKELETDYEGLMPEYFGEVLVKKDWPTFHSIAESLMEDITRLKKVALKYQHEGYEGGQADYEDERSDKREMSEQRAYRILGMVPPVSSDLIKKTYRVLAQGCHSDHKKDNKEEAETRMKELNSAYSFLKAIGKCN